MSDQPAVSIAQTLEALTREVRQMKAEADEVKAENERLHRRLSDIEGRGAPSNGASPSEPVETVTEVLREPGGDRFVSRRGALRALGGAAAGGVGLAIGSTLLGAGPAAANEPGGKEGTALIIGASGSDANSASSSTQVITSAGVGIAGATGEGGQSGVEGQDLTSASPFGIGVTGTSDGGTGVSGQATSGVGVTGETANHDGYGIKGICVEGSGIGGSGPAGVWGDSSVGLGILGTSTSADGIRGITYATGFCGVSGADNSGTAPDTGGIGILGNSLHGIGGQFLGGLAPLLLVPSGGFGPPKETFAHAEGEIYIDEDVAIFVCTAAGSPGTWREVTAAAPRYNNNNADITGSLGVGGSINLLSAPIRVFDSRNSGATNPANPTRAAGRAVVGTPIPLTIAGAQSGSISVPDGAVGVIGNVTVTDVAGDGWLTLYPDGAPTPITTTPSTLNYQATDNALANACTLALGTGGTIEVVAFQSATHVIFDVAGFVF